MKSIHNIKALFKRRKFLRNNSTPEEILLWNHLKKSQLGVKFRRQHSIGGYIVDFYCPSRKLAIELDGPGHTSKETQEYDKIRDSYLSGLDIRVLRLKNSEIDGDNIKKVLFKIKNHP